MNRKFITILLLLISSTLIYYNYVLVQGYYGDNYYNVTIETENKEIIISEEENSVVTKFIVTNNTRKLISSENNVYLSYHLLDSDKNLIQFDFPRTDIDEIGFFSSNEIEMEFLKPKDKGNYIIQVDLIEEGVTWFEARGNKVLELNLIVQ